MLLSRNPACFFCFNLSYGLRPLTSWRVAHTRPRGNQRLFPLGTPSRPATFSNSEKVAMGIDPAFNFACSLLRPSSKMLTLPCTAKASLTSCQAHAIFINDLKTIVDWILLSGPHVYLNFTCQKIKCSLIYKKSFLSQAVKPVNRLMLSKLVRVKSRAGSLSI